MKTIVVIGAGASGIGASITLRNKGYNVIIVEARDRVGGRVEETILSKNLIKYIDNDNKIDISTYDNTHYDNNFIIVQNGANWIHGLNPLKNPMAALAMEYDYILHQTSSDDEPGEDVLLYNLSDCNRNNIEINNNASHIVTSDDYRKSLKRYDWMKLYLDLYYESKQIYDRESEIFTDHNLNLYEVFEIARLASEGNTSNNKDAFINDHTNNMKHNKYNNKNFINNKLYLTDINNLIIKSEQYIVPNFGICTSLEKRIIYWFYDRVAIDLGASLSDVSFWTYMEGESDGLRGEALVLKGYRSLFEHLLQKVELDIRLQHVVTKISVVHNTNNNNTAKISVVKIECANEKILFADACIVTIPIGVLQANKVQFLPYIPYKIATLCNELTLGTMNLVWLWFPEQFWPDGYNFLGVITSETSMKDTIEKENKIHFSTFLIPKVSDNLNIPQPVLMCQIYGQSAILLESLSEQVVADQAWKVLEQMFPNTTVPHPIGCIYSKWSLDPYAMGSYSHYPHNITNHVMNQMKVNKHIDIIDNQYSNMMKLNTIDSSIDNTLDSAIDNKDYENDWIEKFIYYAGEADSILHRGTVHGAYLSGIKTANQIIDNYDIK